MILRKKSPTIVCFFLLGLAVSDSQNARSYDTSDWIPIAAQSCKDCKTVEQQNFQKRPTGRILNLPEPSQKNVYANDYRNTRQVGNQQQYLRESVIPPPKQRNNPKKAERHNTARIQQNLQHKVIPQQNLQYKVPPPQNFQYQQLPQQNLQYNSQQQQPLSAAQLQQAYTSQQLLPNIDLITRQVLAQSQNLPQQPQQQQKIQALQAQVQNENQYQLVQQQFYDPTLFQQNLVQNYQNQPQQFILSQQQPQSEYYLQPLPLKQQQQQQQLQNMHLIQLVPQQKPQNQITLQQSSNKQNAQIQKSNHTGNLYQRPTIQNINHELLSTADQNYKNIDIKSTTPKSEKENIQLLYVPLEHLQQKQKLTNVAAGNAPDSSQKVFRQKQVPKLQKQENLLESIEKDFIQQALQAHRLQQEFDQQNFYSPPIITTTHSPTTTLKPVSRKRKPHQPPLAIYMNEPNNPKVTDVLNVLKAAKGIKVQDSIGPGSPHIFVGPANLDPPDGFSKFELPYLSNIESNRVERKVDQFPFFVAPLNYKTPSGYSKIPFPSPHVGSVVVNNNELENNSPLEAVPSIDDFLGPYQDLQSISPNIHQGAKESTTKKAMEEVPVYYIRRPPRTRGRQQHRLKPHSNVVIEQSTQAQPTFVIKNSSQNLYTPVSSILTPNIQNEEIANVEISNPSLTQQRQNQHHENYHIKSNAGIQEINLQDTAANQQLNNYYSNLNQDSTTHASRPNYNSKVNERNNYNVELSVTSPKSIIKDDNRQITSTPKYSTDFEIIPSISSSISPYDEKADNQKQFQELLNLQNNYKSSNNPQEQYKYVTKENNEGVEAATATSPTIQNVQDDRRYLPLNSQQFAANSHVDYDELFQLPLNGGQLTSLQKDIGIPKALANDAIQQVSSSTPRSASTEKYRIFDYPILGSTPKPEAISANTNLEYPLTDELNKYQLSNTDYDRVVAKRPEQSRKREKINRAPIQLNIGEYVPIQQVDTRAHPVRGKIIHQLPQDIPHENFYNVAPVEKNDTQYPVVENDYAQGIQHASVNDYQNPSSQILQPILPGLINSLEDPSIRQLLTPILLAPTGMSSRIKVPTSPSPSHDVSQHREQLDHKVPININFDYEQFSTTSKHTMSRPIMTPSIEPVFETETTTQRRLRTRGRGNSRYNDRTTTNSPRRNPQKIRTQHPSRTRFSYQTTSTSEAYIPIKQEVYTTTTTTTTTDVPIKSPTRQRFRTRGRPIYTESYIPNSSPRVHHIYPVLETTAVPTDTVAQSNVDVEPSFYDVRPIKKPQLITRSKVLTPEEEYLVNKYNLDVSAVEEPISERLKSDSFDQNTEDIPEQRLDSSKTVNIQQAYTTSTTATPVILETESPTVYTPVKPVHVINRNQVRTEHTPVKIRARIRGRAKTTQKPTTTSTTQRIILSSTTSVNKESEEDGFYGFFRQPTFTKPAGTEATIRTSPRNDYYAPVSIRNSPKLIQYEDEYVEDTNDGVQIYTNNEGSPSTPVQFIGEILPKFVATTTSEKYFEATHEPLPVADKYISNPPSTTTEKVKRRRTQSTKTHNKQDIPAVNVVLQSIDEPTTRRSTQRIRGRGRTQYKLPNGLTTEQSSDTENYPKPYLKSQVNHIAYHPQTQKTESPTEKSTFQITIDPGYDDEDTEDQEPHPSILSPKVIPLNYNTNHWLEDNKINNIQREISTTEPTTTEIKTEAYETTTPLEENLPTITTQATENTSKTKRKKKGYWKLVKLRKITDEIEGAESQNIGVVSVNRYPEDEKSEKVKESKVSDFVKPTTVSTKEESDLLDSIYNMFRQTTIRPAYETTTDLPETSPVPTTAATTATTTTTTTTTTKPVTTTEVPTTNTAPFTPEELLQTTTIDYLYDISDIDHDNTNLDDVTIDDDNNSDWNLDFFETSTSTSTEISHETEICYKGICVKSNKMK